VGGIGLASGEDQMGRWHYNSRNMWEEEIPSPNRKPKIDSGDWAAVYNNSQQLGGSHKSYVNPY
jgi:hypothetical protein